MKIFSNQTSKEQRNLWSILTPSVLSIVVSAIVVVIAVGGTIFLTVYHTSSAPVFISQLDTTSNKSVNAAYTKTTNFLDGNSAFSDAPLAMFWALVGVGVYAIVISLSGLVRNVAETERQTKYMHVNKQEFRRVALTRLFLRLFATALIWFVLAGIIKYAFPYALAAAHVASQGSWGQHIIYAIAASAAIFLPLHVLVVTVRMVLLRVRLFS